MKYILILSAFLSYTNVFSQSEITFNKYEKQTTAEVGAIPDYAISASTTCNNNEISITFSDLLFSGGCIGTTVRTYTAKDNCGNSSTTEQYIHLTDNTKPSFVSFPKDTTVSSLSSLKNYTPKGNDNSKMLEINFEDKQDEGKTVRTWTITDKCGNTTSQSQTIYLK